MMAVHVYFFTNIIFHPINAVFQTPDLLQCIYSNPCLGALGGYGGHTIYLWLSQIGLNMAQITQPQDYIPDAEARLVEQGCYKLDGH